MLIQDLIAPLGMLAFTLITVLFVIRYYNLLRLAQEEYMKAKNIVREIVLSLKRRQDRQDEVIGQLALQVKTIQSSIERLMSPFQGIESQLRSLVSSVTSAPVKNEEVIARIDLIKTEVNSLAEKQEKLQHQLTEVGRNAQLTRQEEKDLGPAEDAKPHTNLTETEQVILQFLLHEGAQTSPEVEKKIGKTREHTARLMKKLWQEGYIERDTHRIPYVYRVTENFKKINLKELEKKS